MLRATSTALPDATALLFMNYRMTYRALQDHVDRLATAFARLGVQPGQRVAVHLPTLPQTVIAYYAALTIGAQVVLTNPLYTPRELEHQWNDAECVLAVTADFLWDQKVRAHRAELAPRDYVVASIPEYLGWPLNWLAPLKLGRQHPPTWARVKREEGVHRFAELVRDTPPAPPRPTVDMESIAVLQYTGGTTGVSKGAMLTHRNLTVNVAQINAWFPGLQRGKEVTLVCLPLFHVFGMTVGMNWSISHGAAMVLLPDPRDFPLLVKSIAKHRVTLFPGVPALFNGLNNFPGIESIDVRSVRSCFSGSAPIAPDVLERFEALTGARIVEGFGMSETSPVVSVNPLVGTRKIGSVGIPISDTDARVVSIDGGLDELPRGEEGELVVQGPQVMKGYWKRPDETQKTMRDGWLLTGDLATMDEDGYIRIVGRKKDMISAGGFKIYPDEVDAVLMSHPDILEAATIGVPDPRRGETVKSFLVLRPGRTLTFEDLDRWCRERLAAYKVPREIEVLDELPKSNVMKVLRRELRERELRKRGE
ncbi:MAG: long-chain fatty acid--CoA ligase [Planctomycetes bacterium]|nr:long-chain fatty acid--CoA ligase [Planctomycetota bacterium]